MRHLFLLGLVACGGVDDTEYPDATDDPQLPPRGPMATTKWIADGYYLGWHCQANPHPPAPTSPHSTNRICTNDVVSTAPAGPFPAGAASIKELYDGNNQIKGYALMRKVDAESDGGNGWYWYEAFGDDIATAAHGDGTCTGCHGRAPRDFAYTVVP